MRRLAAIAAIIGALLWAGSARALPIERVTGASGVTAWLVEDHSLPIVALRFAFAGGAALDPPGKSGTAAMAAALLDEGAGPYDSTAFQARLEELATHLHFSAGQDEFRGGMRTLKANLTDAADMLRLALTEPSFAPAPIERIRAATLAMLARQARDPEDLSARLWMHDAFETHPYGADAHGTEASLAAITRGDLAALTERRLKRNGLVVAIVGDVTAAEAAALIDRIFGRLPQGNAEAELAEAKPGDAGALLVKRLAVPQSAVTFGQVGPKRDDPAWYAALILNDIIGGGNFRGRLMKEIREKRGLAYGVSTELTPLRHAGLIVGSVATENARVGESIALIRDEWRRMRDDGPTAAELQDAKTYLTGSFPLSLASTPRIAAVLVQMQLDGLAIDYLDHRAALIDGVTLDEARAVARRLFDPDGLSFAVVGDPVDVKPKPAHD